MGLREKKNLKGLILMSILLLFRLFQQQHDGHLCAGVGRGISLMGLFNGPCNHCANALVSVVDPHYVGKIKPKSMRCDPRSKVLGFQREYSGKHAPSSRVWEVASKSH
ncbi:unnamed protein product [Tetraodon nigroviridis]|uniref:(spotted green pufferfish) hypothetical protein n=1 Tax=Tetraodon nigroviridis TaxID=99883 RepID=Q4SCB4_TETNG|nr:unnamed protein product [Tetraodon nigroviridis]